MRTAALTAVGGPPQVLDQPEPSPAGGETLVRVEAAALGHLDRTVAAGHFTPIPALPHTFGVEGAGTVVQGALPAGTPVWIRGAGVGVARPGTCAELVAVPDVAVHQRPAGTDPTLAACFFSPATSAAAAVGSVGRLQAGERVVISGAAGSVGSLAVQLALETGAQTVTGLVRRPGRAAAVPGGAQVAIGTLDDAEPLYDLLIDTVGGPGLPGLLARVRPGGRAVLLGYTAGADLTVHLPSFMVADVALLPLNMVRRAADSFAIADDLLVRLSAGSLRLAVTARPLSGLAAAWDDLGAGRIDGRLVLLPGS